MDKTDENLKSESSETTVSIDTPVTCKKEKSILSNRNYKSMNCKVISYNKKANTLDVLFDGYGIRVNDVKDFNNTMDTVDIQYKGEIGKPNFEYKILNANCRR